MAHQHVTRRLAAILAADVVGYSRLMGEDEVGTLATLRAHREELIEPKIAEHEGRVVKLMGDGILAEFPSAVEAVRCAVEIQHTMGERNADVPEERRITYRIGINIGDIIVEDEDIFGDGVNVAARLEGLADPGGVCVRRNVRNQVRDKLDVNFEDLGEITVKNIARPVRAFRVVLDDKTAALVTPVVQDAGKPVHRRWLVAAAVGVAFLLASGGVFWWQPWAPDVEPASVERMAFPLPDKPSIAVLPFSNMSDDPEQEYFADGMTEDLITDLSKISGLFVIARNSTFTYKGKTVTIREVAEELGVRYVLEGSVRRVGKKVRINAQLIDGTTGGHVWADRYDGTFDDIFALQDKVIGQIVAELKVKLTDAEQTQLARIPTTNLEAYDYYLRAEQEGFYKISNTATFNRTLSFYKRAIELDPAFADAYAGYARTVVEIWRLDYSNVLAGAVARKRAYEAAGRALTLDPNNARAYSVFALLQLVESRHEEAIESARKAVTFHPNNAEAYANLGLVLAYSGLPAEAVAVTETGLRLNPAPPPSFQMFAGITFYTARQYDRAIEALTAVRDAFPTSETLRSHLAAAYAHQGRLDLAKVERDALLEVFPAANLSYYRLLYDYYRRDEDRAHHIAGLQKAGVAKWPFGFEGRDEDRLDGNSLMALTIGQTWVGKHPRGVAFIQAIDKAGNVAYRSANSFLTGTAQVRQNMLCQKFDGYFSDRVLCGYVYRNSAAADEADKDYVYVSPDSLKYFSLAE